jgi:putative membrane protein
MTTISPQVTAAVTQAESLTSAEFIVVGFARAHGHHGLSALAALAGALVSLSFLLYTHLEVEHDAVLPLVLLGSVICYVLSRVPSVLRVLVGQHDLMAACDRAAAHSFLQHHVHTTAGRTGILVAHFAFERRTIVLADIGIERSVGKATWDGIRVACIAMITATGISAIGPALHDMARALQPKLPRSDDDRNELSDDMQHGGR